MNNNSILKKEFKERDVQRLRNLVQGKYGDKTTVGTGYQKAKEFHNEGDIWEEDNRTWTIKNGIKQNITKLDKAKENIVLPSGLNRHKTSSKYKPTAAFMYNSSPKNIFHSTKQNINLGIAGTSSVLLSA